MTHCGGAASHVWETVTQIVKFSVRCSVIPPWCNHPVIVTVPDETQLAGTVAIGFAFNQSACNPLQLLVAQLSARLYILNRKLATMYCAQGEDLGRIRHPS